MRALAATATLVALAAPARAQEPDYFANQTPTPLTYRIEGERTGTQKIWLVSLAGGAVLAGGLGLYYNLESRDIADEVGTEAGAGPALVYTPEIDERRRTGERYAMRARVLYGLGGALVIATAVYFVWTSPDDRVIAYGSDDDRPDVTIAPVRGGAVIGAGWSF